MDALALNNVLRLAVDCRQNEYPDLRTVLIQTIYFPMMLTSLWNRRATGSQVSRY
jgi:hypothetical protein